MGFRGRRTEGRAGSRAGAGRAGGNCWRKDKPPNPPNHVRVQPCLCVRVCKSVRVCTHLHLCTCVCLCVCLPLNGVPMRRCSSPLRPCVCQNPGGVCIFMLPIGKTRKIDTRPGMNNHSIRCAVSKCLQRGTSPCFARPLQHYTSISSCFFSEPTRRCTNDAFSATTPFRRQFRPCNEPFVYGICARKPNVARRSSSSQRACTKEKRAPVSLSSRTSFPFTPTGNL